FTSTGVSEEANCVHSRLVRNVGADAIRTPIPPSTTATPSKPRNALPNELPFPRETTAANNRLSTRSIVAPQAPIAAFLSGQPSWSPFFHRPRGEQDPGRQFSVRPVELLHQPQR